jgi:DtxR family transcriptional regulator, Mn-dependent transcriptional regulator
MTRLSILPTGSRARVVLLAPELRDRADRLASLGISPGSEVQLLQRLPTYVVEAGETRLALDAEVARRIFVQRLA